jgi:hypothetical protein
MIRLLRTAQALFLTASLAACGNAPPQALKQVPTEGFAGIWVMNLGTRTFMVLTLENANGTFTGTLVRPERFDTSNGVRFSNLGSETIRENVVRGSLESDTLRFVAQHPRNAEDQQEYEMRLIGQDSASIRLADIPIESFPFVRGRDPNPRVVYADWEPRRSYSVDDGAPSNPEMQRLFDSDQRARKNFTEFSKEANTIAAGDVERRTETRKLLLNGTLRSGEDYKRAAFIFQHGATADDYLLAHTLAMVAVAKGDQDALWIASASLDRYLHSTGKRQIFGTQIKEKSDHTATLEPYDRDLVADVLRRELGVQPIDVQEQQLESWTEQFKTAAQGIQ